MFTDCSKILAVKLKCISPYGCFKDDQPCLFLMSNNIGLDHASMRDWGCFCYLNPVGNQLRGSQASHSSTVVCNVKAQ